MKTIEERAYAYYEGDIELLQTRGWLDRSDIEDIVKNAYVQGATEQKEIDDKELESYVAMTAKEVKQVIIDKAYNWLKPRLQPYELEKFKRFMEE